MIIREHAKRHVVRNEFGHLLVQKKSFEIGLDDHSSKAQQAHANMTLRSQIRAWQDESMLPYRPFDQIGTYTRAKAQQENRQRYQIPVTMSQARGMIYNLCRTGVSSHSGLGATLWVIEEWAAVNGHELEVTKISDDPRSMVLGYTVRVLKFGKNKPIILKEK